MSFTVYPALDIRNRSCGAPAAKAITRAKRSTATTWLPRAQAFAAAGAQWMHLVDLDAAKAGGYTLASTLGEIARATGLRVQTGGGVRSREDVVRILDAGRRARV
ncbi:HisA/HisF-related TIM barrel protein [Xanthomonas citri pv. fuscans]|uniref:HisA/HisF-related TIM barrel protein n=1 Tax=Xanthomonas citri TaxID=346 RepID=UPI0022275187|nr:HisA/HisF-related TIM barrel protein [Xanthomonas citri]UZB02095.1 HisA/HisF-related TIM barrel protein [Xanthomonas citri pv. fuscans]